MPKPASILFFLLFTVSIPAFSQSADSTVFYLLTCGPGNDVSTIYGHSAIRVVKASNGFDQVFSWGVYDFDTPDFVWKFAKGRLKYKIDEVPYELFLREYVYEKRPVFSQKINLTTEEKGRLILLLDINMQPENTYYYYDFFYDNCATRIRDILEKTLGEKLVFPVENNEDRSTFRDKIDKAQQPMPWLTFGTDLLIGCPGDRKAGFRDCMFLPEDLMKNLSLLNIKETGQTIPLLEKPVAVLNFDPVSDDTGFFLSPLLVFSMLFFLVALWSVLKNGSRSLVWIDRALFFLFSALSVMMLFCNFFTDHEAMRMNLHLVWLNPILFIAFIALFIKSRPTIWFKIILMITVGFLLSLMVIPQSVNLAVIPVMLILVIRSAMRSNLGAISFLKKTK